MLTENQLRIFEPLTRNILREYTIKEIKEQSKEKSNNALSLALKKFKAEKLIKERKVGKSWLYTLNIENDFVFHYLSVINNKKLSASALRAIERVKEEVLKVTPFLSIVVFGSYAVGKQTKDSDLDIAVFIEEESNKKGVESALHSAELKTPIKLHGHVIPSHEFLEMLAIDYENVGKEIARKHLSIYNLHIFYSLLKKGILHGFKF